MQQINKPTWEEFFFASLRLGVFALNAPSGYAAMNSKRRPGTSGNVVSGTKITV